jgi:hypothetical protein
MVKSGFFNIIMMKLIFNLHLLRKRIVVLKEGYIKYSCGKEEIFPIDPDAHDWSGTAEEVPGTNVYVKVCPNCTKRGYFNKDGFPVASPFGAQNQN